MGTCDLKEHCSLRTAEPYARLFSGHVPCLFVMGPSVRQVSAQEAGKKRDNRQRNGPGVQSRLLGGGSLAELAFSPRVCWSRV